MCGGAGMGLPLRISSVRGSSLLFCAIKYCFPKNDPASMLGIPQSSADPPLLSKTFNAAAKEFNAKAKKVQDDWHGRSYNDS